MTDLFVSGGTAGFMYWALFYPLDVLKSALQTDAIEPEKRRFPCGVKQAAQELWAEGGVARFYKGVTPCLLRAIPANAIMLITVVRVFFFAMRCSLGVRVCGWLTHVSRAVARRRRCARCWGRERVRGRDSPATPPARDSCVVL